MIGDAVFHKTRHVSGVIQAHLPAGVITVQWNGAGLVNLHVADVVVLKEREEPSRRRHQKNPSRRDLYLAIEFLALKRPPTMPEIEAELTIRGYTASNYFTLYSGIRTLIDTWWVYRTQTGNTYRHHPIRTHL